MSQCNKITTRCLPLRWWVVALAQAVTGAPLVSTHFKGGRHPVAAGGERPVGNTELSLREWVALTSITGLRVHIGVAVVGLVRGHDTLYRHGLTHRRVGEYGPLKEKINIGVLLVYA